MGSFGDGDHAKGENPALSWVQRGIDRHNAAAARRTAAAPFGLRLMAAIGITAPYYKWQMREPLWPYYDK
jgi:hypothetical protein